MIQKDPKAICHGLKEYISFFSEFGDDNADIPRFGEFISRFEKEKITKGLLEDLVNFRDAVHNRISLQIRGSGTRCLPGKDSNQTVSEYYRVLNVLGTALNPPKPKPAKMDISGFAGAKNVETKTTEYEGDPNGVRLVVERSLELVKNYSEAVGRGDFEAAHRLTGAGLQEWMTFKKFLGAHEKAATEYGGPALEFHVDSFLIVLADDTARKSAAVGDWPKTTLKEVRRSKLIGFWIRDKAAQTGCWGSFYITEENKEYRVAKFEFFTQ